MTTVNTLFPINANTLAISGSSTASASVGLPALKGSIRLLNEGPDNCYVCVGPSPSVATLPTSSGNNTCTPVAVGEDLILGVPDNSFNSISIICRATKTCVLIVSSGEGM